MLDAYIIERIQERKDRPRDDGRAPLRIEYPSETLPPQLVNEDRDAERGIVEIDFSI